MRRKNDNLLGLSPLSDPGLELLGGQHQYEQQNGLRFDKRHFVDDSPRQLAAMEIKRRKTIYGMSQITAIDRYAETTFCEMVAFLIDTKQQDRDAESQMYVDEFTKYMTQVVAQQILAVTKIGALAIAEEVARPPFFMLEEPSGFWDRLFGR